MATLASNAEYRASNKKSYPLELVITFASVMITMLPDTPVERSANADAGTVPVPVAPFWEGTEIDVL